MNFFALEASHSHRSVLFAFLSRNLRVICFSNVVTLETSGIGCKNFRNSYFGAQFKRLFCLLDANWNPQALVVVEAYIINILHHIWKSRNLRRYHNKNMHWKTCIMLISSQAKLIGNNTNKRSNNSISNFSFLKKIYIRIHPGKSSNTVNLLWTPLPLGWIKCNTDGSAIGSPTISSCGGISRNDKACHLGSFGDLIGVCRVDIAALITAMIALKKPKISIGRSFGLSRITCWLLMPSLIDVVP